MAVFSIIKKSQLEGSKRLDAEYYQPEYLTGIQKIKSSNFDIISNLLSRKAVTGTTPKRRDCINDGTDIKFVKTDTLREGQIVFDEADCLPVQESRKNSELKSGDIIVTIIGATHDIVGRVARVFPDDPKMNINQNVGLLRPKESSFSSYLSVFLQTKYGRNQLWQQSKQTEQVNLNCREVERVLVPIPDSSFIKEVDDLVVDSYNLVNDSKKIYSQAENLLLEELELKDFSEEQSLCNVVNFSELKEVNRIDAEYFQLKYDKLLEHLKNVKPLIDVAKRVKHRVKIVPEKQYQYIEISDVDVGSGEVTSNTISGKELPANAKIKISGDELLVSKVRPTRGAIAIISDIWKKDIVASGAFSVFDSPSPLREYLQVVLRSTVGKLQMERPTTGTSYPTITDADVENIQIPILPRSMQEKIAELVRQSHESRKKAKALLEEAKHKVEELIETRR